MPDTLYERAQHHVSISIYMDHIALWCLGPEGEAARIQKCLQVAHDAVDAWLHMLKLSLSVQKSVAMGCETSNTSEVVDNSRALALDLLLELATEGGTAERLPRCAQSHPEEGLRLPASAHCGVPSNENADKLAATAHLVPPVDIPLKSRLSDGIYNSSTLIHTEPEAEAEKTHWSGRTSMFGRPTLSEGPGGASTLEGPRKDTFSIPALADAEAVTTHLALLNYDRFVKPQRMSTTKPAPRTYFITPANSAEALLWACGPFCMRDAALEPYATSLSKVDDAVVSRRRAQLALASGSCRKARDLIFSLFLLLGARSALVKNVVSILLPRFLSLTSSRRPPTQVKSAFRPMNRVPPPRRPPLDALLMHLSLGPLGAEPHREPIEPHTPFQAGTTNYSGGKKWLEHRDLANAAAEFRWRQMLTELRASLPKKSSPCKDGLHSLVNVSLPENIRSVLGRGPKYAVEPRKSRAELLGLVRSISRKASADCAERHWAAIVRHQQRPSRIAPHAAAETALAREADNVK
ncbi:hypothetical protein HPB52_007201 [Rhipicephalus sanguineus]|uniref:Uncharacterized protein n=1 Tax=Rhipicephalus sanguineus TaxID=34632 RepID=A0A9D4QHA6_RHISA|nr:hypothetical protein HPB52_007201 [Rhipicephalus sanguineus]